MIVRRPPQTTYFLFVTFKFRNKLVRVSDISVENSLVTRSSAQQSRIPSESSNSVRMAYERTNFFHFKNVPHLNLAGFASNSDIGIFLGPADTGDE